MKLKDYIDLLVILVVIIIIRTFLITPARVDGPSMDKTLQNNEIIIVNKINYTLNKADRFDIVVFKLSNGKKLIKRVIGLPGEKIKCENNQIYINDEPLDSKIDFDFTKDFKEVEIPNTGYFVLGDNRNNSTDSRSFGPISEDNIIGTVKLVLYPFNKLGFVK